MSCFNTKTILNKTNHYYEGVDPLRFDVPCCHCEGCRQDARNEWYLRSYGQFLETNSSNGFTLFVTLTYNNDCLPTFGKLLPNETKLFQTYPGLRDTPCFNKHDILRFLWRLKKGLKKEFNYDGMRHLITSEFGEERGRAHYHGLIFFPYVHGKMTPFTVLRLIRSKWQYGFVGPKPVAWQQAIVTNYNSMKYISKYCCKDLSYFGKHDIIKDVSLNEEDFFKIKPFLPKHWQSHHFGEYLKDYIISRNLLSKSLAHGFNIPGTCDNIQLPRYLIRKLLYVAVDDNRKVYDSKSDAYVPAKRYQLTELGKQFKLANIDSIIKNKANSLQKELSFLGIYNCVRSHEDLEYFNSLKSDGHKFENRIELYTYMKDLLRGYSYEDLASYYLYLDGVVIDSHLEAAINKGATLPELARLVAIERIEKESKKYLEIDCIEFDDFENEFKLTLSRQYNFSNFDKLYSLYKRLKSLSMSKHYDFKAFSIRSERVLREYINYNPNSYV